MRKNNNGYESAFTAKGSGSGGLTYGYVILNGLDPATNWALDSDNDGWPDWQEVLAGTATNSASGTPQNSDGSLKMFDATITLGADLPRPALLSVGGRTLVLLKAGSQTLTLREGVAHGLALTAAQPCTVSLSCSLSSAYAALQDASGAFSGGVRLPGGGVPVACGVIAQPAVDITPERVCFHSNQPRTVAASVTPVMEGTYAWYPGAGTLSSNGVKSVNIARSYNGAGPVTLRFTAAGASRARTAVRQVALCTKTEAEDSWCDLHDCEDWYCACDNGPSSSGHCGYHGRPVAECLAQTCPTHHCPYSECPPDWCHKHGCLKVNCPATWCYIHNMPWSLCPCPRSDPHPYSGGSGNDDPANTPPKEDGGEPAYGSCDWNIAAVNNDDDNASGSDDLGETGVAGENDLAKIYPLGPCDGQCCACPEHRTKEGTQSAELAWLSGRLALYADAGKTNAFAGTAYAGVPVYVEGLEASAAVNGDRALWTWTDANNLAHTATNAFTVFSVRLFGDTDLDGDIDAADKALAPSLSSEYGWGMPAATNVFRRVRLQTDVRVPGGFALSLSGDTNAFRVWATDTPGAADAPLLSGGKTSADAANYAGYGHTDLFVEALSNGTATLKYSYTGTDAADGLSCSASLKMTAWNFSLRADTDRDGNIGGGDEQGKAAWTVNRGALVHPHTVSSDRVQDAPYTNLSRIAIDGPVPRPGFSCRLKAADDQTRAWMAFVDGNGVGSLFGADRLYAVPSWPTNLYVASVGTRKLSDGKPLSFTVDLEVLQTGKVVFTDRVLLAVAPVILPPECNAAETVYAIDGALADLITGAETIPADGDQWTQDQVKFVKTQHASGVSSDLAVTLEHKDAGNIEQILTSTNRIPYCRWSVSGQGGNMMATPPLPGAPYGKIMIGTKNAQSQPDWTAQGIQPVVQIANDWLFVGHVDEILMWAAADKVLFADPWKAADLMHGEIAAGRGSSTIWWGTDTNAQRSVQIQNIVVDSGKLGAIAVSLPDSSAETDVVFSAPLFEAGDVLRVDDEILALQSVSANGLTGTVARAQGMRPAAAHTNGSVVYAYSEVMRKNLPLGQSSVVKSIAEATNQLRQALGSYQADFVPVPVLFNDDYIDESNRVCFVAQTANMVNCLVVSSQSTYYSDPGNALFRSCFESIVPGAQHLDVWNNYHCNQGEVHCGTAVKRVLSAQPPWWEQNVQQEQWEDMP